MMLDGMIFNMLRKYGCGHTVDIKKEQFGSVNAA